MSVEENKAIVRRLVEEGWTKEGLDILDEIVDADIVVPGQRGLDAYKQLISEWHTGFPDARWVVEDIIAEGDKVVACWKGSLTHTGEFLGIPPTNKQVSCRGTYVFRVAGGKVVEHSMHWSIFGFYTQLGLIPPWEEFVEQAKAKLA